MGKIFVIGFNKCGTTSLTHLFRKSGHKAVHTYVKRPNGKRINIAERVYLNRSAGNPLLRGIDTFAFYSDIEQNTRHWNLNAIKLFREFDAQYPESRFILNTRDKERWLRSRANHFDGRYMRRFKQSSGLESEAAVLDYWSREWDEHLEDVRSYFADKPKKLIQFDIDQDSVEKLNKMWPDLTLDDRHWKSLNVNKSLAS